MKKQHLTLCVAMMTAALLAAAPLANAQLKKVGTVDLSRIFDEYQKTKDYDKVLEEQYNGYDKQRQEKVQVIEEKQGKLALLNDEEKKKAEEELQTMINDLQQFDLAQRTDLTKKRDERIREILLEVEQLVSGYAKQEGFDLILNDRVLIYGNESLDITNVILEKLNASYKK